MKIQDIWKKCIEYKNKIWKQLTNFYSKIHWQNYISLKGINNSIIACIIFTFLVTLFKTQTKEITTNNQILSNFIIIIVLLICEYLFYSKNPKEYKIFGLNLLFLSFPFFWLYLLGNIQLNLSISNSLIEYLMKYVGASLILSFCYIIILKFEKIILLIYYLKNRRYEKPF